MSRITRVLIKPNTFNIFKFQKNQNPYIDIDHQVTLKKVIKQHNNLEQSLVNKISFKIDNPKFNLPDIVFAANGGLSLPRIPNTIILPYMKYKQRKEELEYLKNIYESLKLKTIQFPGSDSAPFEGQAELKWFHNGTKAICGYGHRSTQKTFHLIQHLFNNIYKEHNLLPPELLIVPLESPEYYHLDVAMLEFHDSKCIIHKEAFNYESINKIKKFLGNDNVHLIDTSDKMCLNAIVDGNNLITHKMTDSYVKSFLERTVNRNLIEVDTTEFEKSGGSVRCMTLDVFTN